MRISKLLILLLLAGSTAVSAGPLETCADGVKQAIGKVTARRGGKASVSSGFLYGESKYLVTALHSVAGADQIEVSFIGERRGYATGRVVRCLTRCDLALIELDPPPPRTPLGRETVRPEAGQKMVIVGFPLNVPRHRGEYVHATATNHLARLDSGVPPDIAQRLSGQQVLDVGHEVLHLQAPLKPGHSGAPILDDRCRLVGVGDGGVNQGPGLWSWAIPANNLADLLVSTDPVPSSVGGTEQLFSNDLVGAEFEPEVVVTSNTGQDVNADDWFEWLDDEEGTGDTDESWAALVKIGTRSLAEIQWSLEAWAGDDPMGLQTILLEFAAYGIVFAPEELLFDVYQEEATGASVVLPAGAKLEADENGRFDCRLAQDRIRLIIATYLGQNPQWATNLFEQQISLEYMPFGVQFQLDPSFTYMDPDTGLPGSFLRWDGTVFARKSYQMIVADDWGNAVLAGYAFENLSAFEESTLACVAISEVAVPENLHDRAFLKSWLQAVVGVHISSLTAG